MARTIFQQKTKPVLRTEKRKGTLLLTVTLRKKIECKVALMGDLLQRARQANAVSF